MKSYFIANYDINELETYQKYVQAVGPTIIKYGGKVIVGDREPQKVEGNSRQVIVVIEFASIQSAEEWYNSSDYKEIKNLRITSTEGWNAITKEFIPPIPES